MLMYMFAHFFAGLWTLVWHFGVGAGIIILLCVGAYMAPTPKLKLALAILAVIVGGIVLGEAVGVHIEKKHTQAQQAATNKFVDKTVKSTVTPKARRSTDPWDNRNY